MRHVFILTILFFAYTAQGQNPIEWDGNYELQFSDFQSPATQIGGSDISSLQTASGIEFSFYMSTTEFMFTNHR